MKTIKLSYNGIHMTVPHFAVAKVLELRGAQL
jgi:hypothetical protein